MTGCMARGDGTGRRRGRGWRVALGVLGALVLAAGISVLVCAVCIRTVRYSAALDGVTAPVRLVCVSDLHGRSFGRGNARLAEKIAAQEPDAICLLGDMLGPGADETDAQRLLALVARLREIAPVYFAVGNHEQTYLAQVPDFLDAVMAAGAVVVNDSYVDVTLAGQPLRIGGTFGHAFPFGRTAEEFAASPEYRFLTSFEDTDRPTVCLAHMPDTFIFNGAAGYWDVDLVLSGHTHGGLIRLPWVGGLYAPMQGWFPPYDRGQFWLSDTMQLIITSGLAGYKAVPRVNNLPEIAVVTLTAAA